MKYDCSKTLDFFHEFNRMRGECQKTCEMSDCKVQRPSLMITNITQTDIEVVQKWSDEHQE